MCTHCKARHQLREAWERRQQGWHAEVRPNVKREVHHDRPLDADRDESLDQCAPQQFLHSGTDWKVCLHVLQGRIDNMTRENCNLQQTNLRGDLKRLALELVLRKPAHLVACKEEGVHADVGQNVHERDEQCEDLRSRCNWPRSARTMKRETRS